MQTGFRVVWFINSRAVGSRIRNSATRIVGSHARHVIVIMRVVMVMVMIVIMAVMMMTTE